MSDLAVSLGFYRDVLGFRESFRLMRGEHGPLSVFLRVSGEAFLELFPSGERTAERGQRPVGY